jgi:hypothetical protein
MLYQHRKYHDAVDTIRDVRRDIIQHFTVIAREANCSLVIVDSLDYRFEYEANNYPDAIIHVDLAANIVRIKNQYLGTGRIHEGLARVGVPHVYEQDVSNKSEEGIVMDIDTAQRCLSEPLKAVNIPEITTNNRPKDYLLPEMRRAMKL